MSLFQTQRLSLELVQADDAAFILQLLNSPNWLHFIGDREVHSEEKAREYIEQRLQGSQQTHGFSLYKMVLRGTHEAIGLCGFVQRDYLDHADIGFAILPEYEGQGYTTEAALATMDYGIRTLGLDPILGFTTEENIRSQRLLTRIGLKRMGTFRMEGNQEELLLFSSEENPSKVRGF